MTNIIEEDEAPKSDNERIQTLMETLDKERQEKEMIRRRLDESEAKIASLTQENLRVQEMCRAVEKELMKKTVLARRLRKNLTELEKERKDWNDLTSLDQKIRELEEKEETERASGIDVGDDLTLPPPPPPPPDLDQQPTQERRRRRRRSGPVSPPLDTRGGLLAAIRAFRNVRERPNTNTPNPMEEALRRRREEMTRNGPDEEDEDSGWSEDEW